MLFSLIVPALTSVISEEYPYIAPSPTDDRGPCPGLNTLANHGYLNRNGRNITGHQISWAMRKGFGFGASINFFQFIGASLKGALHETDFGRGLNSLKELGRQDGFDSDPKKARLSSLDHDCSLTRSDFFFFHDSMSKNLTLIKQLLSFSQDGQVLTRDDLSRARQARIDDTRARNLEWVLNDIQFNALAREQSLLMMLLGEPIRVDYAEFFLTREKLPIELGWTRREPNDIGDIVIHMAQTADFKQRTKILD